MEHQPVVTVIVPVYRVEAYLRDCLDSVAAQTLSDWEMICIDDASPDGCGAILDEYARADARIRVIHLPENRGQGFGRNLGLAEAKGTWCYFLDSDDMIAPDALRVLAGAAESERLDGIFFDSEAVFETETLRRSFGGYPAVRHGSYPDHAVSGPELFSAFIRNGEWTCYVQRQFWNTAYLRREGIENPVRAEHEDEVFAFTAILAAERVRYLPFTFFIRRYRADSVMTSPVAPKNFHGYLIDYCHMLRFVTHRGIRSEAVDRNLARIYEKIVRYYRMLHETCDLASLFREGAERELYEFFASTQRAEIFYAPLSERVMRKVRSADAVWIYGAGVYAGHVFERLARAEVVVEGFLVTDAAGNPSAMKGRPVRALSGVARSDGALVVIAVSESYRKEVEEALSADGWESVYYAD